MTTVSSTDSIATFAAVFATLWVAHTIGDHWVQTSVQSADKGQHDRNPGQSSRVGRLACTRHVIGLTLTKALLLALAAVVLDLPLSTAGVTVGLGLDASSHWWADRRSSLAWLAKVTGKSEFYSLGTGAHAAHPVTAKGKPAGHLGTGAYALDLLCTKPSLGGALTIKTVSRPQDTSGFVVLPQQVGSWSGVWRGSCSPPARAVLRTARPASPHGHQQRVDQVVDVGFTLPLLAEERMVRKFVSGSNGSVTVTY